jgi:hypothetical protein
LNCGDLHVGSCSTDCDGEMDWASCVDRVMATRYPCFRGASKLADLVVGAFGTVAFTRRKAVTIDASGVLGIWY